MNVSQFLVYENVKNIMNSRPIDTKREKLIVLGIALITRNKDNISPCVKNALDEGISPDEILRVISIIVGDEQFLDCLIEFLRALRFEENNRQDYISAVEDCRED